MEASLDSAGTLRLGLTFDEAFVLFEWLHRNEDRDIRLDHLGIVDDAERQVLWSLSACLESNLVDPFRSDYDERLESARASLRTVGDDAKLPLCSLDN
jgi:hypothetical protein